jgi:hypothetical protein
MLERVQSNQYYRNIKTGNVYLVLAIAQHSEDPTEFFVCYCRKEDTAWVRPLALFKEKFEEI